MSDPAPEIETESEITTDELERLVAENPEEVARFIRRLGLVNDLLDASAVASAGLDDRMVEELAGTGGRLAEVVTAAATPGTVALSEAVGERGDDLAAALETLANLERSGTLADLVALADVVSLAGAALDDGMVERVAATGTSVGGLADTASDEDVARGLEPQFSAGTAPLARSWS